MASLLSSHARAVEPGTGTYVFGSFQSPGQPSGIVIPYAVHLPPGFKRRGPPLPLVLFLHGSSERGTDGVKQTQAGIGPALERFPERYPAVVLLPQIAKAKRWEGSPDAPQIEAAVMALLSRVENRYATDPKRVTVTGLSLGGKGAWAFASHHPDRFAALLPICGGGDPASLAPPLARMPIWAFHGSEDQTIPVQASRDLVAAVRALGNTEVRYTEYAGAGHVIWDEVYSDPFAADWLFSR
jgi:predicted peptidase